MISALIYTAISCESLMSSIISQFSLETTSNPFESNESTFLSTDSKVTQRKKRKSRFLHKEHEDAEIQAEINKGNTVNIIYDSDP